MVGAKVCELTDSFLWFVCGLYVGILTSPLSVPLNWYCLNGQRTLFTCGMRHAAHSIMTCVTGYYNGK